MTDNNEIQEQESHQKILVADDEASIRRILEARLSMIGYEIITATDGEEAIAAFNKHNPDLIRFRNSYFNDMDVEPSPLRFKSNDPDVIRGHKIDRELVRTLNSRNNKR